MLRKMQRIARRQPASPGKRLMMPLGSVTGGGSVSPYYTFGYQRWYADSRPHGMPMPGTRAAETRQLGSLGGLLGSLGGHTLSGHTLLAGIPDVEESSAPRDLHFPALSHHPSFLGDWPALRPAGPEPLDPEVAGPSRLVSHTGLGLSDMEKKAAVVLALGAGAFFWWRRRRRKRRR